MPAAKKKVEYVVAKFGRKLAYLVVHAACGTRYFRRPEEVGKEEYCGVCGKTGVLDRIPK